MKKIVFIFVIFIFFIGNVQAEDITQHSQSAVLMEITTGKILYEIEGSKELPPASMTKIMSMILIMEAINNKSISLKDEVLISETASSMGGSQVYLNTNEKYKVEDLLKCVAISSANDAVVALAEKTYGTVEKFVEKMNNKCTEIGCKNTSFMNPHGLDMENHYSSAYDMALMAKYLISHYDSILKYTSIYEDYLKRPDGSETWLVNTNKLVRFYDDVDGLKTGFTKEAGFCLTSTAKKGAMRLISVVMGADNADNRTSDTVKLLNYGFNSYRIETIYKKNKVIGKIRVEKGKKEITDIILANDATELLNQSDKEKKYTINIDTNKIVAPIKKGDIIGSAEIIDDEGSMVDIEDITVNEDICKASLWDYMKKNIKELFIGKQLIINK